MNDLESDEKQDQVRGVFAYFGLAFYEACCLEKEIAILLSGPFSPAPGKVTKGRVDDLFDASIEKTLGELIKQLENKMTLTSDVHGKLNEAVEKRNWLAHYYWWDRSSEFNSFEGRQIMIKELDELKVFFEELNTLLSAITRKWLSERGIDDDTLQIIMDEELAQPTPKRLKRRRLKKFETLLQVYIEIGETGKKQIPIFKLSDQSLWELCDCGLTYAPDDVEIKNLQIYLPFQKAIPAEITPRPKDAKPWDYKIPLSTGFNIRVSPFERDGEFVFKWGLFKS